ncbi:Transforming growth factor-beta receptor-associated protein 1 [Seiridium cupressi]
MASDVQDDERSQENRNHNLLEPGPFVLRTLLRDVPLSADGAKDDDVKINCVDYLDGNLYVGTTASELIHFVKIPPDPSDATAAPVFVQASRLQPAYAETPGSSSSSKPGVQQILLLPRVGKACILCNWTVTFYSLPELSPVFNNTQVKNCNWIGGIDLNEVQADYGNPDGTGVTILLSLNRRIQVVKIGEDARGMKKIDIPATSLTVRRDTIACVADSRNYSLLEIERQLKIPLMSISSLDDAQPSAGQAQDISGSDGGGLLRSNSSAARTRPQPESHESQQHRRGTSLGNLISGNRRQEQRPTEQDEPVFQEPPEPTGSPRPPEPLQSRDGTPQPQAEGLPRPATTPKPRQVFLKPHIVSPTPEEFLLVTGTGPLEPGIGMFVNLDGDPTRPTIEFDRYPKEIVVDGVVSDLSSSRPNLGEDEEGYVLASMGREFKDGLHNGLEIQRWDTDGSQPETAKYWLEPPRTDSQIVVPSQPIGIRSLLGAEETSFQEIVERLCQQRFKPFSRGMEASTLSLGSLDSRTALSMVQLSQEKELFERDNDSPEDDSLPEGWESNRNNEEKEFARRLAGSTGRLAVWSGDHIWWALRNPLILQLDAQLEKASNSKITTVSERRELFSVLNSFRGRDAKSELEFLTFNYLRQKAGVLLLTSFLHSDKESFNEPELRALEEVLVDSLLDPRVVLALIPSVRNEVIETRRGIWIFGGVKATADDYIATDAFDKGRSGVNVLPPPTLQFLKRFLTAWRRKKGFGSIPDENEVFRTVDAALLAVLLELDQHSPSGLARGKSIRSELYELVDNGVDCFERAETLIESYHRLFVLSRLYQSRRMAEEVLTTWRRIVEGERDDGGEFRDGEQRIREYLSKISNQALVREYGIWLANRNPKLGVQVFAEENGRAQKLEPTQVVEILRSEAPDAVKYYLEYLVFGQGHTIHVNELVTYYLDIVITHLESSQEARDVYTATYAAYRALHPMKPTYRQFLTDNAPPDDEVWQSRLRLLQLLGGQYDYDSAAIRKRIASLESTTPDLLVPETIILDGRERKHENALRLLVHGLGDYDTAVAYCLRGGASIYSIYQSTPASPHPSAPANTKAPKRRESAPPTENEQARLFRALLSEFLDIEDVSDRVEQTGMLLERFGGWFDVDEVLSLIPDSWSVDLITGFLVRALRRMVVEKNETNVARALSSSQYLRVQHDLVTKIEEKGPTFESE